MKKRTTHIILTAIAIALNVSIWAFAAPAAPFGVFNQGDRETSITIRTTSGETYGFFGNLEVIHDGTESDVIDLELNGWLVGYDDGTMKKSGSSSLETGVDDGK